MPLETAPFNNDKLRKISPRMFIGFLGLAIFVGLILFSVSATKAEGVGQASNNHITTIDRVVFNIGEPFQITGTVTTTPTDTPTGTSTLIITSTLTATPTSTSTPTPTSTSTGTATATSTFTATPTITGTPPTATSTATQTKTPTPGASLSVSVSPSQAKVNESFTFTISVGNVGVITTTNNIVVDSFPAFLDIVSVSTTKGSVTKLSHSFNAAIGDLGHNASATLIAVVRVNNTLTQSENLSNVVTLYFNETRSTTSSVVYRVVLQSLPGTGELPLNWRKPPINTGVMIPGLLLMGLGIILLALVLWSKNRTQRDKMWMAIAGILLILVGFITGASASGWLHTSSQAQNFPKTPTQNVQGNNLPTELAWQPASAFSTPDSVIPIVTLPDYPIPTPIVTITPQPGETGPDLSPVVRIVIPSMMLDTVVKYVPYDGFSWLISGLRQEVAWMGNTSWPGLGSNTSLAGHVTVAGLGDGPFRHLEELPVGELVLLYTEKSIYTYQVRENKVTDDGDMSVTAPTNNPQISLITCTNWDNDSHTYLNRLVVIADLVRSEPALQGNFH